MEIGVGVSVFLFLYCFASCLADDKLHETSTSLASLNSGETTTELAHIRAKRQFFGGFGGGCGCMMIPMCPCSMSILPAIPPPIMMISPLMMGGGCCGSCLPVCMPVCLRMGCGGFGGFGMGYGRKKREALIARDAPVLKYSAVPVKKRSLRILDGAKLMS